MKIINFILFIFLIASISGLYGQNKYVLMRIYAENELEERNDKLKFGLHENATDGIDRELLINDKQDTLAEFEIPFKPPSGLFTVFETPGNGLWSYLDFRPYPTNDSAYVRYKMVLRREGDSLFFEWFNMPEGIDSAHITDANPDFDLFFKKMERTGSVKVENEYMDKFYIHVWYNKELVSVEKNVKSITKKLKVYPNSAFNQINIQTDRVYKKIEIYNYLGRLVTSENITSNDTQINVGGLERGIYFVRVTHANGNYLTEKFFKR